MSWGISVRFQTLSLIQRQVAHALLTRPPLSYPSLPRRFVPNNSVRLECVMHAASVHPEPGSNSRMFVYYVCLHTKYLRIRVSLILAFSFTLFRVVFFKTFDEIRTCFSLCTSLLLFNFQWPSALFTAAWLLYHTSSRYVKGFLQFFWENCDFIAILYEFRKASRLFSEFDQKQLLFFKQKLDRQTIELWSW